MNILQKTFIAAGIGITGFSWPYIQTAASFASNKIHSLLPTVISTSKPYLLWTPYLSGISLLSVFLAGSVVFTKCEDHSVPVKIFERGMQGITWYTTGIIGGVLSSSILSAFSRSPHPILNTAVPLIGAALAATFIGCKLSKLAAKPLHALCEMIDNGASNTKTALEERLERYER